MNVSVLRSRDLTSSPVQAPERPEETMFREAEAWNAQDFAREQIRGLVRQVFFSSVADLVRQVVFTALEPRTDLGSICRQVGETLSQETRGTVAVVSADASVFRGLEPHHDAGGAGISDVGTIGLHRSAIRARSNLWFVPGAGVIDEPRELGRSSSGHLRLCELGREFEYSVVQGPPAIALGNTVALGQRADGVILVLAAHSTRRAAARKIKETLDAAQVRLLGVVLSERTFPIPERIYRHL